MESRKNVIHEVRDTMWSATHEIRDATQSTTKSEIDLILSVKSPSGGTQILLQPGARMPQSTPLARHRGDW